MTSVPENGFTLTEQGNALLKTVLESAISRDAPPISTNPQYGYIESAIDELVNVISMFELRRLLDRTCEAFRLQHITIHVVAEGAGAFYSPRVLTTYSPEWIDRYFDRGYENVDPVTRECKGQSDAFFWSHLISDCLLEQTFFADAAQFGVGPSGYSTFVSIENGDRFAVSISSAESHQKFENRFGALVPDLSEFFTLLINVFAELASPGQSELPNLSGTQLQVLRAFAAGETTANIAEIPISFGSLTCVKREICKKLFVTTMEDAVKVARRTGLLRKVPLSRTGVVSSLPPDS